MTMRDNDNGEILQSLARFKLLKHLRWQNCCFGLLCQALRNNLFKRLDTVLFLNFY